MRAIDPARFPNVTTALREAGLDPSRELVPVAPAAHYMMGGIVTDQHARSTVAGLYAVGEVSCTGLHGANRLASNSLSECFVFARRAASSALQEPSQPRPDDLEALQAIPAPASAEPSTRTALWQQAGIERSREGLQKLASEHHPLARLIARCALERQESRGAHQRVDHPERDRSLDHRHFVITSEESGSWQTWT
jgi:L-aspartate oxidase